MKTSMKELQDALEIYSRHNKGTPEGKAIDIILSAFPKFIEAEKEQIKNSYGAGAMDASYDFDNVDSEKYYLQTFKSDE